MNFIKNICTFIVVIAILAGLAYFYHVGKIQPVTTETLRSEFPTMTEPTTTATYEPAGTGYGMAPASETLNDAMTMPNRPATTTGSTAAKAASPAKAPKKEKEIRAMVLHKGKEIPLEEYKKMIASKEKKSAKPASKAKGKELVFTSTPAGQKGPDNPFYSKPSAYKPKPRSKAQIKEAQVMADQANRLADSLMHVKGKTIQFAPTRVGDDVPANPFGGN